MIDTAMKLCFFVNRDLNKLIKEYKIIPKTISPNNNLITVM